jgi:branched-chain amino acid transport system ATP-binding protein
MALLEVSNLHRSFGGLLAVDGVSFQVRAGQIKAIIGPNGAGKTTLFNIISGLLRPDDGEIVFKGHSIRGWAPHRIAQAGMSRTFQNPSLFLHMDVIENPQPVPPYGRDRERHDRTAQPDTLGISRMWPEAPRAA